MGGARLLVASNRGPVSFTLDERGRPKVVGSAGGLASALQPLFEGRPATWVACAMSDADRLAADAGLMDDRGFELVMVQPDPGVYRMAYDVVANSTLWYLHHNLFDLARRPRFDRTWATAWEAYRSFNRSFAAAVAGAAEEGATVLVQDYHLCLLPKMLAEKRPDLRTIHFTHTPFADPILIRVLPQAVARELLEGMAAARACGFHTARWEAGFRGCCQELAVEAPPSFVGPLTPDPDRLASRIAAPGFAAAVQRVDDLVAGRKLVVRVDRVEPAKNMLRGLWAFDEMLRLRPDLRGKVVLLSLAYPSRESLPEYQAYRTEVDHLARRVNDTWGDDTWTPVAHEVADDPDRSLAALTRYDVLLVNPVRDGLNLVAKEGPLVNTTHGVLALSREAGSFEELRGAALEVNPFDVAGTAEVLAEALDMPAPERARRAQALRALVRRREPSDWLVDQLTAAGGA